MAIFADDPEVRSQLDHLGLTLGGLQGVVQRAAGGFAATTEFHPSSAAGTYLYHEGTAALRLWLVPMGWEADELDGQPRTLHRDRGVAIVVQTGDENTGIDNGVEPRPRHPKGLATRRKIDENFKQYQLFDLSDLGGSGEVQANNGTLTWVLLMAVVDGRVRAELSLPRSMGEDNRPCGWVHRIFLPEFDLGGGAPFDPARPADHGPEQPDVEIEWKQ